MWTEGERHLRLLIVYIQTEEEALFVGKLDSAKWEGEQTAIEIQMYEEQTAKLIIRYIK